MGYVSFREGKIYEQSGILHINRFLGCFPSIICFFLPQQPLPSAKDAGPQTENNLQTVSFRESTRWAPTTYTMVVSGSPNRWDRSHSPSPNWQEKYHLYTTYSPCLLGGYMLPTTC